MCGIVAMIARTKLGFLHSDMEVLENMLVLDTLRGLDSTGVFAVDNNRNVGIMKIASNPYHLFACTEWGKMKSKLISSGRIIVGHNRKATQGAVNSENAHPFHENNIVLVHNGTLRGGHKKLADTEVDSHAVCHAFNEKGAEEVIPTIDGAFAFVWWDMAKGRLFAIRNEERPLSMVITKDLMTFASEPWMARAALERASKKVEEVVDLKEGMLYEFDLNGDYTFKPIKLLEPTVHTYMGSNCDPKKGTGCGPGIVTGGNVTTIKQITDTSISRHFTKGRRMLMKIWDFKASERKTHIRVTGKVVEPGVPPIDMVINVSTSKSPEEHEEMMLTIAGLLDGYITAEVSSFTNTTNGGPSVYAQQMQPSMMKIIHNGTVSQSIWNHVVTSCKCRYCQAKIYDEEAEFTIVESPTASTITVACADCVEDKLPLGDIKNEFNERRVGALQVRESVSDQSDDRVVHLPQRQNSPTVH